MKIYLKEILFLIGSDIKKIPWMLVAFLSVSMLDVLGLGLIAPYVALIINPDLNSNNYLYSLVRLLWTSPSLEQILLVSGCGLVLIFILKMIFSILINRIILNFANKKGASLRADLMSSYQKLSYLDYSHRNSADYLHSIQTLAAQFSQNTLQAVLRFISEGIFVLAVLVFLAWTNFVALSILTSLIVIYLYLFDLIFRHKITEYGRLVNETQTQIIQDVREAVDGFKEIRVLGKERYFYEIVKGSAEVYADTYTKLQVLTSASRYILEVILILFIVIIVFYSIFKGHDLALMIPTLTVFGVASLRLMPAANVFSMGISQMRFGRNATTIIYSDLTNNLSKNSYKLKGPTDNVSEFNSLDFKGVDFTYAEAEENVLNDISISIKVGESIGIIGPTGSGKTTLINIMLGLLKPTKGEIYINKIPVESSIEVLRNNTAYLPQNIFLIDNTIRKNIALGLLDSEIDEEKVLKALNQARLADLVEQLPDGLDTHIGEQGIRLSGGQRQRVALARALYHDRKVLVMDEATSALDNETESEIVEEISRLKGKKTTIVIAHRLSTVKHCDRIYKLEKGKIIAFGIPSEVIIDD